MYGEMTYSPVLLSLKNKKGECGNGMWTDNEAQPRQERTTSITVHGKATGWRSHTGLLAAYLEWSQMRPCRYGRGRACACRVPSTSHAEQTP